MGDAGCQRRLLYRPAVHIPKDDPSPMAIRSDNQRHGLADRLGQPLPAGNIASLHHSDAAKQTVADRFFHIALT